MHKKTLMTVLIGSALLGVAGCTSTADTASSDAVSVELKIGGSSEAYEILEQLTEAYRQRVPNTEFKFFSPSQTIGGIRGVKENKLDIGGLSRALTAAEVDQGLTYIPLVEVPLVMIAHESVTGVTDISAEQIKAIYSGQISNWQEIGGPDADIVLLDFVEDENEKKVLREAYLGEDLNITPQAIVFTEDDELIEGAAVTDYSIAAAPLEDDLDELPVNILSIDGIKPSPDNIQSGDYVMTLPIGIALAEQPSSQAESFIAFVASEEGQQFLNELSDD